MPVFSALKKVLSQCALFSPSTQHVLHLRCAGTPLSKDGSATPASVGIKLAERLQEVASQLQHPAAGEPLAHFAATPGQPAAMQTPGAGRIDFAADVAAMLQVGGGAGCGTGWMQEQSVCNEHQPASD